MEFSQYNTLEKILGKTIADFELFTYLQINPVDHGTFNKVKEGTKSFKCSLKYFFRTVTVILYNVLGRHLLKQCSILSTGCEDKSLKYDLIARTTVLTATNRRVKI